MKQNSPRRELQRILEWAQEKAHDGTQPPWAWFQYMKLIESIESIVKGMDSITTENLPQSESRPGNALRLVVSTCQPSNSPHRQADESVQMPNPLDFSFDQVLTTIADEERSPVVGISARPFLKWVGGKRSILPELGARMPKDYIAYYEPFLGGGALFFDRQPQKAFLSDINFHLIITYQAVRDDIEQVIQDLKIHAKKHDKNYYLKARMALSIEKTPAKLAAWFIYLNKTCYNGLYRVNKSGLFNVPMGDYKDPPILDEDNLRAASKLLQGIDIKKQHFTHVKPAKGVFYYLDPPYHKTYDQYNGGGFGDDEHKKLAELCHAIHRKGGYFMLSNSDTDFVRDLYKPYAIEDIMASRSVSCKSHQRGRENELIIRNYQ